jgi:hypothetical protein
MSQRIILRILILFALTPVSASTGLAQSATTFEIPLSIANDDWQVARQVGSSKRELFVVTLDQPHRRQTCRVQSFTLDKLVCSRPIGGPRTYLPQQIVALLLPGDGDLKLQLALLLNAGLGAAIWGTVVLAAPCPACAAATGIVALLLFGAAGAILIGDDQPNSLLYFAPGQQLSRKLGYVQR